MIIADMYVAIKTVLVGFSKEILSKADKGSGHFKSILMALIACIVLIGGFYSYKFYIYKRESGAHKNLQECLQFFETVRNGSGNWKDVQMAFENGYKAHTTSSLAPYFLGFKADALIAQDKKKEALESMQMALEAMNKSNEFYGLYEAKLALIQLDSGDAMLEKKAIENLQTIVKAENSGTSTALYYLGLYYFDKNDIENAKKYWQELFMYEEKDHAQKVESGLPLKLTKYAAFAKEKIDQLN